MTNRDQAIDALAGAIARLIAAMIAGDQGVIGGHQRLTAAQGDLREALRAVLGARVEERAASKPSAPSPAA